MRISSCGPPGSRSTAEISIASKSVPLAAILPEVAASCLPEDARTPPPGYELAIWGGVSAYGADSVLFVGTLREVEAIRRGEENVLQPEESGPVRCQIFQPKYQGDLPNASILQKGACLFGGEDMGYLVFARRDCTSLSDPGALIFPGREL